MLHKHHPFAWILAVITSTTIFGDTYQYHPNTRLYMGGGFNPYRPTDGYLRCIIYDGLDQVDTTNGNAARTDAKIMLVKTRRDFYEAIEFSASLGGGFLFFSGQGSVQMENESAFQSDSLSWLILFRSDFGRFTARNPRFLPEVESLSTDSLYNRCGPEIVTEERRGVMVYALFTVSNLTETQKRSLSASFSSSFSNPVFNVSAEAHYKSFMRNLAAVSKINITVNAIGGKGITSLVGLIDKRGDHADMFEKYNYVPHVMANYIKEMNTSNSVPVQYVTTHLSRFLPTVERRFADFKTKQIGELFSWHQDVSNSLARMRSIMYGNAAEIYDMNSQEAAEMQSLIPEYTTAMNEIYKNAQSCFMPEQNKDCELPAHALTLRNIKWPQAKADISHCRALCNYAQSANLIKNQDELSFAIIRNFVPLITFDNNGKPSIEEWVKCEDLLGNN